MSTRKDLAAVLRENLPNNKRKPLESFAVEDVEDLPDSIDKATVIICHRDWTRAPNAQGSMFANFIVTVATPLQDRDKAEDHLEWAVPQVMEALDKHAGLIWGKATRVVIKGRYLAYDIDAQIDTPLPY